MFKTIYGLTMAQIISVSNHKGGVGKTTVAANIGFSLARNFKTLLIDLDPQANLSSGLGVSGSEENIEKYFKEIVHFRSPTILPYSLNNYVDIIPGNIGLLKIEKQLHDSPRSELILKELLIPIKKNYDLIIIDCPPSFDLLTINALRSSSLVLIPARPELFSLHGIESIKNFAKENGIKFKIFFNQVNSRSNLHTQTISKSKERFNGNLMHHTIRNTVALAEAFENAKNIFNYRSKCSGAMDFEDLAEELIPYI